MTSSLICVVDDDREMLASMSDLLRSAGYSPDPFMSAEAFLDSSAMDQCKCVVTDIEMPGMSGVELARTLRSKGIDIPLIAVTGHERVRRETSLAGWSSYLMKPFEADEFLKCIQQALRTRPDTDE